MKKIITISLILAVFLVVFAGAACAAPKHVLRLGHNAGLQEPTHLAAVYFADELKKRSNGDVVVNVFPSGQLGDQVNIAEAVMEGTIDVSVNTAVTLSNWLPQLTVLDLPYLFFDTKEADAVFSGELIELLDELIGGLKLEVLGWGENGFRQFYNNVRPINAVADFKGLKVRSMSSPIAVQILQSWGTIPTPMPWMETMTGLQQGTVDGGEGPLVVWAGAQMGTAVKYISITNHQYTTGMIFASKATMGKLPSEVAELVREVGSDAGAYMKEISRKMEEEARNSLEAAGAVVNVVPDEVRREMAELTKGIYTANRESIGPEFYDRFMKLLGK